MPATAASEAKRRQQEIEASRKRLRERTAKGGRRLNISRPAKSAGSRFASGRATRGQGSFIKRGVTPTLCYKAFSGSIAGDSYAEKKAVASFTGMLGKDAKERAEEFKLDMARHPGVSPRSLIRHVCLSLPTGKNISVGQWQIVVALFLKKIDAEGCNYVAHLHSSDNKHVHLIISRARPDGKLVDFSWNYIRHRQAAGEVADEIEILGGRETPRPSNTPPSVPSDRSESARRRAVRRGTTPAHIDPAVVRAALERSSSPVDFARELQASQIEMSVSKREDGTARGLLLRRAGAEEWLAGSSISRDLSLARVQARLAENAASAPGDALRHQAQEQARSHALRQTQAPTYSRERGG